VYSKGSGHAIEPVTPLVRRGSKTHTRVALRVGRTRGPEYYTRVAPTGPDLITHEEDQNVRCRGSVYTGRGLTIRR